MKKSVAELQENALNVFQRTLLLRLKVIRIVEGGTKKSRSYTHVFVPGEVYGGKLGSLLCKKPYREWQAFSSNAGKYDMCPVCAKKLRAIAQVIANEVRPFLLFTLSGEVEVSPTVVFFGHGSVLKVPFTDKEIDDAMRLVLQRQAQKKTKKGEDNGQLALVDMEEAKAPVRKTQACLIPPHLFTSEAINP